MKQCKICDKQFKPKANQKTCSDKCSHENHKSLKRKWYGAETKLCKWCGKEFMPKGCQKTCSKKCSHENRLQSVRRSYHRVGKLTDDRYERTIKQKMRRIAERIRRKYVQTDV